MNLDLDLRKLRYFVAVAERLHFGRAAEALHITQPALSRQIRQLERELGVELFVRTSRDVTLTPAGEQLLADGRRLLSSSRATLERVRRTGLGGGERSLTIGFMLGTNLGAVLGRFTERHPDVHLQLERLRWWNQAAALVDGQVDAGFVRLPIDAEGLRLVPLATEPILIALPSDHPLAGRAEVDIAQLSDEPVLSYADAPPAWNAFWSVDPRPDGSRPWYGPQVRDMEEIVQYVRTGQGVVFLPEPVTLAYPRPGVAYVPVTGIPPGQVALAWDAGQESRLIADLASAAAAETDAAS